MAIVPMQKVAVIAHKAHEPQILDALHAEGVMEISSLPDPSQINSTAVNYHAAELDHVIALLSHHASPTIIAATDASVTSDAIIRAGQNPLVRSTIDAVHHLEEKDAMLKEDQAELDHGRLPRAGATKSAAEEGAYFTAPKVETNLSSIGAKASGGSPSDTLAAKATEVRAAMSDVQEEWKKLAEALPLLCHARQYIQWMNEIEAARRTLKKTKSTITLFGWMNRRHVPELDRTLSRISPATALIPVEPDPHEQAPILIENPAWLKPFESVTLLYGLPQSGELDPTPMLAPFFLLFFALCLTDAGYGAILAIVMAAFIWKKGIALKDGPLWWLLMIGGIATFLISIPFGGWFGLSPDQAPAFMTETRADGALWFKGQIWNLGATPGITFFQNLSIVLGLIHLCFGMLLGGISKGLRGNWAEGIWSDWSQLLLIGSAVAYPFLPADYAQFGMPAIILSVIIVIWGKGYGSRWYLRPLMGFLGLLNLAMGMMSNVLSYLRLLALGLVTGALALAVNLVAQQIGGFLPAFIGIPVTIAIYLVGHTTNIALNVLGAFIHSGRLQFVEFFSQFFEGGGRAFSPFRRRSA